MSDSAVHAAAHRPPDREVIWHDLECGSYAADLPLWRKLAANQGSPVLELGAGTGRVTLELARRGHRVVALDSSPELLGELRRRAGDADIETVLADARSFALKERFGLCIVPMQTVQLMGGVAGRGAMLACSARHLRPGGMLAIALSQDLQDWRAEDGGGAPLPDSCERDGTLYFSQPTAVYFEPAGHVLERRRETVSPTGQRAVELDRIRLDHLDRRRLEREAAAWKLHPAGQTTIPATVDYTPSEVVMFRA